MFAWLMKFIDKHPVLVEVPPKEMEDFKKSVEEGIEREKKCSTNSPPSGSESP